MDRTGCADSWGGKHGKDNEMETSHFFEKSVMSNDGSVGHTSEKMTC